MAIGHAPYRNPSEKAMLPQARHGETEKRQVSFSDPFLSISNVPSISRQNQKNYLVKFYHTNIAELSLLNPDYRRVAVSPCLTKRVAVAQRKIHPHHVFGARFAAYRLYSPHPRNPVADRVLLIPDNSRDVHRENPSASVHFPRN
jgi:hypothetical protein